MPQSTEYKPLDTLDLNAITLALYLRGDISGDKYMSFYAGKYAQAFGHYQWNEDSDSRISFLNADAEFASSHEDYLRELGKH